jgi:hypothetical protein
MLKIKAIYGFTLTMEAISSIDICSYKSHRRCHILEDGILHSHCRENIKSYITLTGWALQQRSNVSRVRYELGFYIPEDGILQI